MFYYMKSRVARYIGSLAMGRVLRTTYIVTVLYMKEACYCAVNCTIEMSGNGTCEVDIDGLVYALVVYDRPAWFTYYIKKLRQ